MENSLKCQEKITIQQGTIYSLDSYKLDYLYPQIIKLIGIDLSRQKKYKYSSTN